MLVLKVPRQRLDRLAFAPDGPGLAAAGRLGVYFWADPVAGEPPAAHPTPHVLDVAYAAGGTALLATTEGHGFLRFGRAAGDPRTVAPVRRGRLAVSPDGAFAAVYDGYHGRLAGWRVGPDGERQLWSVGDVGMALEAGPAVTPDGSRVIAPNPNPFDDPPYHLCEWSAATGELLAERSLPWGTTTPPAVSPDGSAVAFGDGPRLVVLRGGEEPRAFRTGSKHLTGVAFHPSGRLLAATSNDATVTLYDAATWRPAATFTWGIGRLRSVAFAPDGTLAAAGSDNGRVVVWDVDG